MSSNADNRPGRLPRTLTQTDAVLLTLSVVTPASSMFIIMPGVIAQAGTGVIFTFLPALVIACIVALVYSELASDFGSTGGEYVYVEKVFHEIPAYPIMVVNFATQTFITSVLALGAGDYFHRILPIDPRLSALIVVGFATLFGVLHIKTNVVITGLFFLTELAALIAVSYFGVHHISQGIGAIIHPVVSSGSTLATTPYLMIAMATAATLFAFNGYEEAIYLNEEMKRPRTSIVKAIMICFALAFFLEAIPTVLTLLASPDISSFVTSTSPYLDLVGRVSGSKGVLFISAAVSLAVLNACIANVLLTARFVFSTTRSGFWRDKWRGDMIGVNKRNVPVKATLLVGFCGAGACFLSLNTLFVLTGTGLVFIYATLCVAIIVYRRRHGRRTPIGAFRMPYMQTLAALGLLGLIGVLYASWLDPVIGRTSILVSLGEILFGLGLWFFQRKVSVDEAAIQQIPESDTH